MSTDQSPQSSSPRLARWLLHLSLNRAERGDVLGDLEEAYAELVDLYGQREARRWYWSQSFRSAPKFFFLSLFWSLPMLSSYLTLAIRTFFRQKTTSLINVFSLALGIAFCALIFLFVEDELAFDKAHDNYDRIVRINLVRHTADGGVEWENTSMPLPLAEAARSELSIVESAVSMLDYDYHVKIDGQLYEQSFLYVEASFFDIFTAPTILGDAMAALNSPDGVVLTKSKALQYFGKVNAIGETITVRFDTGDLVDLTVLAVVDDAPKNVSVPFEILLPLERLAIANTFVRENRDSWDSGYMETYALLVPGYSLTDATALFQELQEKYLPGEEADIGSGSGEARPYSYRVQPLSEVHFDNSVSGGLSPASNSRYAAIMTAIAIVILLLACINFMTLATGRSAYRAKEIGVRKVVGADRNQLMGQFWSEAIFMSFIGLAGALIISRLALPVFNQFTGRELAFDYVGASSIWIMFAVVFAVTGLAAGSYPAIVLSAFRPIETLSNRVRLTGSNRFTRGLVVLQFTLSIALVVGAVIMNGQLNFVRSANLGFNKSHLISIRTGAIPTDLALEHFKNTVESRSDIERVSATNTAFPRGGINLTFEHQGERYSGINLFRVDPGYAETLGLSIADGRDFDASRAGDVHNSVMVNEAFVRRLGLASPVGTVIHVPSMVSDGTDATIVGVVEDFNFRSLYNEVSPALITLHPDWRYRALVVRVASNGGLPAFAALQDAWSELAPDTPFDATYMEDDLQELYGADANWARMIRYASGLAVLIACLGLFGIASLIVVARTKEVGIRKVLGADISSIGIVLSRDFLLLVGIGVILAAPISYAVMSRWLDTFAFRIEITAWPFLATGVAALLLALATISFQVFRTARVNPTECLRND